MLKSRRSRLAWLTVGVAVLALTTVLFAQAGAPDGGSATSESATLQRDTRVSCPRALDPGPRAPEGVLRALRAAVPRTWHYTTPDGPLKLSVANTVVLDLHSLSWDSPHLKRFSSYYGKLAQHKCGGAVTRRTWVAVVYFPTSQSANYAQAFAFFARTRTGWKLWYHD